MNYDVSVLGLVLWRLILTPLDVPAKDGHRFPCHDKNIGNVRSARQTSPQRSRRPLHRKAR